ncbi:MAG: cytochrome oxidase subunit III [Chloroflexi bacterium]|nr:MAG: cytochrome oxidase subunit III [Chloroflexota bacterium]
MAAAAHETQPATQHHTTMGIDNRKVLMWIFLASECLFFGALISTYLIFKGDSLVGPYPKEILNIPVTSASTFVLLMSSLTMVLAVYGAQHGRLGMMKVMLLATVLLGIGFLGFQAYEFTEFVHEGLGLTTNQFGSSFFVLTSFHGAHVTVGVLYLLSLLLASNRRTGLGHDRALHIDLAGLYWHFVDVIWIVIFTIIYLIPN